MDQVQACAAAARSGGPSPFAASRSSTKVRDTWNGCVRNFADRHGPLYCDCIVDSTLAAFKSPQAPLISPDDEKRCQRADEYWAATKTHLTVRQFKAMDAEVARRAPGAVRSATTAAGVPPGFVSAGGGGAPHLPERAAGVGWVCMKSLDTDDLSSCFRDADLCSSSHQKMGQSGVHYGPCLPQSRSSSVLYISQRAAGHRYPSTARQPSRPVRGSAATPQRRRGTSPTHRTAAPSTDAWRCASFARSFRFKPSDEDVYARGPPSTAWRSATAATATASRSRWWTP
jgi:hypothetical protein